MLKHEHWEFPYRACAQCKGFAPAAPRRARVRVSCTLLRAPALTARTDQRFGGPLHRQQPNQPPPHPMTLRFRKRTFQYLFPTQYYSQFPEVILDHRAD